jgi:hypothetical protein
MAVHVVYSVEEKFTYLIGENSGNYSRSVFQKYNLNLQTNQ